MIKNLYPLIILLFVTSIASAQWSLTGNSGTTAGPNYIGTNDKAAFMIKVKKDRSGFIDYKTENTYFGYSALFNSTNTTNAAFGYKSLYSNLSGGYNTSIGNYSLYNNRFSSYNVSVGYQALYYGDSAGYNTAVGYQSLFSAARAVANTGMGYRALFLDTTGYNNTAIGYQALLSNNGNSNTANGSYALYYNTIGNSNSATGYGALLQNTLGNDNTANGSSALYSNTAGYSNVALGVSALYSNRDCHNLVAVGDSALFNQSFDSGGYFSNNTAVGSKALFTNTIGNYNTATGSHALYSNNSGTSNTANGFNALQNNSNGSNNTAVGSSALSNNTGSSNTAVGTVSMVINSSGFSNTAIGYYSMVGNISGDNNTCIGANTNVGIGMTSLHGATAIGANAIVTGNNKMQLGSSTTTLATSGGYTIVSDGRFKDDIKDDISGLDFINKLHPVTYNFNYERFDNFLRNNNKDAIQKLNVTYKKELLEKSKQRQDGFIAQEVAKVCADNKIVFSGIYLPQNSQDNYALDYSRFVVPLVKAVQQLSKMNDDKDEKLIEQQKINTDLQNQINELRAMVMSQSTNNAQSATLSSASLQQNIPNPFHQATTINYSIPQKFSTARIIVMDKNGKVLKEFAVKNNNGVIKFDANAMTAGAYTYSLYVDGKLIGTKQMVVAE